MSLSMSLVPVAIGILITTVKGLSSIEEKHIVDDKHLENVETYFKDADILQKTLTEYGAKVTKKNEKLIIAEFEEGEITYSRESLDDVFEMSVTVEGSVDDLLCSLKIIDEEYGHNVQSYTYDRVLSSLDDNMIIESEKVLEDDSILITINIE